MTANDLTTSLLLLVRGRRQLSFARDPSEGGGQITSKGDGLLRSNLPLGDTSGGRLLRDSTSLE